MSLRVRLLFMIIGLLFLGRPAAALQLGAIHVPADYPTIQAAINAAANGDTILQYSANAIIGGKLAQIGQRLIDGAAKSIADEFFSKFTSLMQARHAAPAVEAAVVPSATAPRIDPIPSDEGLTPQVWVAGLIGIIVILLIFFSIVL